MADEGEQTTPPAPEYRLGESRDGQQLTLVEGDGKRTRDEIPESARGLRAYEYILLQAHDYPDIAYHLEASLRMYYADEFESYSDALDQLRRDIVSGRADVFLEPPRITVGQPTPPMDQRPIPDAKAYALRCMHCGQETARGKREISEYRGTVHLRADRGDDKDVLDILIYSEKGEYPAVIKATARDIEGNDVEVLSRRAGTHQKFQVYSLELEAFAASQYEMIPDELFSREWWKQIVYGTEWRIKRPAPLSAFAHSKDVWGIEMVVPPMSSLEVGPKKEATDERVAGYQEGNFQQEEQTPSGADRGWRVSGLELPDKNDIFFNVARNGSGLTLEAGSFKLLKEIFALKKHVKAAMSLFSRSDDYSPQIGWYLNAQVEFLAVALCMEWTKRETPDYGIYNEIKFKLNGDLVALNVEAGYGIKGLGFKAQIYFAIVGGVKADWDFWIDEPLESTCRMGGVEILLGIEVGFRFRLGTLVTAVGNAETSASIHVDIVAKKDDVGAELSGKFNGCSIGYAVAMGHHGVAGRQDILMGNQEVSGPDRRFGGRKQNVGPGGDSALFATSGRWQVDGFELFKEEFLFTQPKGQTPFPLSQPEIVGEFASKFQRPFWDRFWNGGLAATRTERVPGRFGETRQVEIYDHKQLAEMFGAKYAGFPNIDRTKNVVQRVAEAARDYLEDQVTPGEVNGIPINRHLTPEEVHDYLNGEFMKQLEGAIDHEAMALLRAGAQ